MGYRSCRKYTYISYAYVQMISIAVPKEVAVDPSCC